MKIVMMIAAMILGQFHHTSVPHHGVIYVQETVNGNADSALRSAIAFDGRYTTSKIKIHRCDSSHYCVKIGFGSTGNALPANAPKGAYVAAVTTWFHNGAKIVVNRHSMPYSMKIRMFEHELGHAFGLEHNSHCTSVMYYALTCHGHLSPQAFTKHERSILKGN
jgi:Metallo-peptidase family M12B Reprolysin-like